MGTVGQIQLFIFTVTNTGSDPATNVTIINALPTNAIFVQAVPTQGTAPTPVNGIVTANIGTSRRRRVGEAHHRRGPHSARPSLRFRGRLHARRPQRARLLRLRAVTVQPAPIPAGPSVIGVAGSGNNSQLVITFSAPLNATTATLRSNYRLYAVGSNGREQQVGIVAATYNPNSRSVRIVPTSPLSKSQTYRLVVVGTPPSGITNARGFAWWARPEGPRAPTTRRTSSPATSPRSDPSRGSNFKRPRDPSKVAGAFAFRRDSPDSAPSSGRSTWPPTHGEGDGPDQLC